MKRLIVNADDFGLTSGVNRAIVELHVRRALTSATLMARAAATDEAIAMTTLGLGVGCHVVIVDGQSVLEPRRDLVGLVDPVKSVGRFTPTLGGLLNLLYLQRESWSWNLANRHLEEEIEAEAYAQISLLQSQGVRMTHIDTHKHTHMFPRVLRPVLRAAAKAGIRTVRNPFEPEWSIRATPRAPWLRRLQVRLLRTLEPTFRRIVAEEGFTTTDGAIGVLATGTLDSGTLSSLLHALPGGTWELVTHPGYNDTSLANAGTRLLVSREIEMDTLSSATFGSEIELIHFGHLN